MIRGGTAALRAVLVLSVALCVGTSCTVPAPHSSLATEPVPPTATPLPTAYPPIDVAAVQAYMRRVHERVLLDYSRCLEESAGLLDSVVNRSSSPDLLCEESAVAHWQCLTRLSVELSVMQPPPHAKQFHQELTEAMALGGESAQSLDWFCETYAAFGQPAEGMSTRLARQLRACSSRRDELRQTWAALDALGSKLLW